MIRLNVPCSLRYRDVAMRLVAAACKLVQTGGAATSDGAVDPEFDRHVISAFGEAFNNVVLHGASPPGSDVEIEIEPEPSRITIRLKDHGRSIDLSSVPSPSFDDLPESGMGVYIILSCMDRVTYAPGRPNVLTMIRYATGGKEQ
jgi:serine/threonine-protein kinase RsbW